MHTYRLNTMVRALSTLGLAVSLSLAPFLHAKPPHSEAIPGYSNAHRNAAKAPISLEELALIQKTLLFAEEDKRYLRMSKAVLAPQVEEILDVWYGFVGSHPHLLYYFSDRRNLQADAQYLQRVRARFGQWILDTADANYDQQWMNYQFEIAKRHHRSGKNRTDRTHAARHINYRYIPALTYPVVATLKPFLEKGSHSAAEVEKMHQAWMKSVMLQSILWSQPYMKARDF